MAVTGQQIITNALTTLGIVQQGGAPSASDSADALNELNDFWPAWGVDEGLIYAVQPATVATAGGTASYLTSAFAPVGPFSRVYQGVWINAGGQRFVLEIVPVEKYRAHRDLAAAALAPDEMYVDFLIPAAGGSGSAFLWPVPSVAGVLELEVGATFAVWSLGANYTLPQAYQDAINYTLAYRLIPRFGEIVSAQMAQQIAGLAEKAESRLRQMNAFNRKLPGPTSANPEAQQQKELQPQR